jgi:hypothetical protein
LQIAERLGQLLIRDRSRKTQLFKEGRWLTAVRQTMIIVTITIIMCEIIRKEPGTFRVLGLGDSFAFGVVAYAFNYLTVIEEKLKSSDMAFELINMGIPLSAPENTWQSSCTRDCN